MVKEAKMQKKTRVGTEDKAYPEADVKGNHLVRNGHFRLNQNIVFLGKCVQVLLSVSVNNCTVILHF